MFGLRSADHRAGEGDAAGELPGRRVDRAQQSPTGIEGSDDGTRRGWQRTQHQALIGEDGETPGPGAAVGQAQAQNADRVMTRHEQRGLLLQIVMPTAEAAVTEPVARFVIARRRPGTGQRRPGLTARLIAQVAGLAVRIGHRVVVPGRQPVRLAVARPGVTGAAFAHDKAAALVRHDIDPGQRRTAQRPALPGQAHDVFVPGRREPPVAVEGQQPGSPVIVKGRLLFPACPGRRNASLFRHRFRPRGGGDIRLQQLQRGGTIRRHAGQEQEFPAFARRQFDHGAQAEHRIEHIADTARQRRRVEQRGRTPRCAAAAEETHSIGFPLQRRTPGQCMHQPRPVLVRRARAAAGEQRAMRGIPFGLHEQLGEGGMGLIGIGRIEHHLQVAGHLDAARARRGVVQLDAAQFQIRIGGDAHLQARLDTVILPLQQETPVGGRGR